MKRILAVLAVGVLGAYSAAAQAPVSGQAGSSSQGNAGANASKSGVQASGSGSNSSSASAATGDSAGALSNGTHIDAALSKSLDVKKNKAGDPVEARTTQDVKQNGQVVLKKGTRLVGHVTEAQSRTSGQSQSQLGVLFDRAVTKDGQEIPLNATIQALAAAQSAANASAAGNDAMATGSGMGTASGATNSGGGLVGGVASTAGGATSTAGGLTSTAGGATGTVVNTAGSAGSTAGGTLNTASRSTGAVGGLTSSGQLASNSSGVFGLQGLSINSAASNATQGSMIVSSTKNVHLDSGTQMLLNVAGQAH